MKLLHLWREQAHAAEGNAQAEDDNDEGRFGEEFAGIKPIENQMRQSDAGAPLLKDHVTNHEDLGDGAGNPFGVADQLFDLGPE